VDKSLKLPPIVGLTGRAGTGKDTLASFLVREHGYVRYGLADPIKELLNARFGWTDDNWSDRAWKETPVLRDDFTHLSVSPREMAQWLGTEVGRNLAGQDIWVDALLATAAARDHRRVVISDVRFNNEASRIQTRGGVVVNVYRPQVDKVTWHVSERGVDDLFIDYEVNNCGPIEAAEARLEAIIRGWARDFGVK
jgi:adenylylsulfate kinase-like enzyme